MKTIISIKDRKADVTVIGRIDTVTSQEFRDDMSSIDYDSIDALEMDFTDLNYISSAGLRELLSLKKRLAKKHFLITNVSPDVEDIFKVSGFSTILDYTVTGKNEDFSLMSFKEFLSYKAGTIPDNVVLKSGGRLYTWNDIEMCSQIVASDLAGLGVKKGTHVGICGADSANWIITFFAVQKLGAIACLINFGLGINEIISTARSGDITHICFGEMTSVTYDTLLLSSLAVEGSPVKKTYDIRKNINFIARTTEYADLNGLFESKVEADDICVMIFTSGSTGVPKGVLLSAYNILNAACSNAKSLLLSEDDTACLMLPLFHIFGLVAGLFANMVSKTLIIIPENNRTLTLIQTINEEQCTVFHTVPTMLLAIVNNKDFDPLKVTSLRSTILSGAVSNPSQIDMFMKLFPNNHFASSYGLSEMAPVSITDYNDTRERIRETIGRPVENIDIRIFDNNKNEECPIGQPGEIQVQGFNLMSCYYKADLDLQSIDEDGWLHTGDIGFMDEDGYLHFSGRIKDIIIRAGENIYPAEVAEAISSEEGIANVVVAGIPDDFWGERVAAAVILNEGTEFDPDILRKNLSSILAKFKIPEYFFVYESFPYLSNGKIDMVTLKNDLIQKVKNASS